MLYHAFAGAAAIAGSDLNVALFIATSPAQYDGVRRYRLQFHHRSFAKGPAGCVRCSYLSLPGAEDQGRPLSISVAGGDRPVIDRFDGAIANRRGKRRSELPLQNALI